MKTIDDRIDALTQSVELLTGMHKDNEGRFGTLAELATKHEKESLRFQRSMTAFLNEWNENSDHEGNAK